MGTPQWQTGHRDGTGWGGTLGPTPHKDLAPQNPCNCFSLSAFTLRPPSRVTDLVNQQQTLEEKMREDRDSLVERLHRQTAEYSAFKLENERLKVCRESGLAPWVEDSGAAGGALSLGPQG